MAVNTEPLPNLRYAYLNHAGHPRGDAMLYALVTASMSPVSVVETPAVTPLSSYDLLTGRLSRNPCYRAPVTARQLCDREGIRYKLMADLNSHEVAGYLASLDLDYLVLGDVGVLRGPILDVARYGAINTHPGLLPRVRGNNPYIWAIVHDLPQGVSVHLIDDRIDRGPILSAESIGPGEYRTLPELLTVIEQRCCGQIVRNLRTIRAGTGRTVDQEDGQKWTFRAAPSAVWDAAELMLQTSGTMRLLPADETERTAVPKGV